MPSTYAIGEIQIPKEYTYKDYARIMINGEMINILVTEYSEVHTDNFGVANMLSDSISMFTYGAMPITITMSGIIKESMDNNHMYNVMKKYSRSWRQRLITDYTKNTTLTIMDAVMDFAITNFTIIKNVDLTGYDSVAIEGIGWNYTFAKTEKVATKTKESETLTEGKYVDESVAKTENKTLDLSQNTYEKGIVNSDSTVTINNQSTVTSSASYVSAIQSTPKNPTGSTIDLTTSTSYCNASTVSVSDYGKGAIASITKE